MEVNITKHLLSLTTLQSYRENIIMNQDKMNQAEPHNGIHFCNSTNKFYTRCTYNGRTLFVGRFKELKMALYMQSRFLKILIKLDSNESFREQYKLTVYKPCTHFCNTTQKYMARLINKGNNLFGQRFETEAEAKVEIKVMKQAVKQYFVHYSI